MPEVPFAKLRRALYAQGISARYAERLLTELREHRIDIEAESIAAGGSTDEAARQASRRLGRDTVILAQVLARPELRGRWSGFCAMLRSMQPVLACADAGWPDTVGAPAIARWSVSITLGSVLTVTMLFALAQAVVIGA